MMFKNYRDAVESLYAEASKGLEMSPASLLDAWEGFVSDCEEGWCYFGLDEFDNDVSIRSSIALIMDAASLQGYEEYNFFKGRIDSIDARFQVLVVPNVRAGKNWWNTCVLKKAGDVYAEDVNRLYGIMIEIVGC